MIYGIGTDIVSVSRVSTIYSKYKIKFINKLLSDAEKIVFNSLNNHNKKMLYLSSRWAAKEAVAKATGIGLRRGLYLSGICIAKNKSKPCVVLTERAQLALSLDIGEHQKYVIHLSISDEAQYAIAYACIEFLY